LRTFGKSLGLYDHDFRYGHCQRFDQRIIVCRLATLSAVSQRAQLFY
jgi:hypothetical protein